MKQRLCSLLLTLCLAVGLAVPAAATGGYQPLTLSLESGRSISFSLAHLTKTSIRVADCGHDGTVGPYQRLTVNLVTLSPASSITVKNGMYDEGYGVPGIPGEIVDSDTYLVYATGGLINVIYQGRAYDDCPNSLCVLHGADHTPYYIVVGPRVGASGFTDVLDSAYYAVPVDWAVSQNITNGTGELVFSPNDTCTTAQILTFLHRANGSPAASASNPFSDVKAGDYFAAAAAWASEKGLVDGTVLRGGEGCTRANVVTYLWKAAGRPASSGSVSFSDVSAGTELSDAVAWAVGQGITNGTTDTTFSPNNVCTRAEIVTFLYRAYAD